MIKDFEIKNFRGIQSLKLEEFSNVNIFVGKPNTGKTSILEALYLYLSKHPDAITNVLEFRKTVADKDCFQGFFYDYDLNNQVVLMGDNEELKIHCRNTHYTNIVIDGSQQKDKGVNEITFEYPKTQNLQRVRVSKIFVNPIQIQFQNELTFSGNNQLDSENADFVNESNSYDNILKRNLETILSSKANKEKLNEHLKKFANDIQEINFLDSRVIIQKENLDNVVSFKLMGAGFQKYVAIILSILQNKKYIFIDEIENGLHFESIDLLLEAILNASNDVQFFITTHNEEFLNHLSILLEDRQKENVAVFNVYTDKDCNMQVGRYSQEDFIVNINCNSEIRANMLIFVEGITDKDFIELYAEYLGLSKLEVISIDGKDNLKNFKPRIKSKVKIIFDADNDINKSKQNIEKQLDDELYSKCKIFLMPNNKDNGNLETLLENIAQEQCILKCFNNYEECLKQLQENNCNIKLPAKKSKAYAYFHAFGFKNGVKNFKMNSNMINFESKYLKPLKNFLLDTENIKDK